MSKRAKTYHEVEKQHCISDIRKEREERDEYNKSIGKSQRGFELHSPRLRANASLKTVVKHSRESADFALYRRDRWHRLEEIAQHLERLT